MQLFGLKIIEIKKIEETDNARAELHTISPTDYLWAGRGIGRHHLVQLGGRDCAVGPLSACERK